MIMSASFLLAWTPYSVVTFMYYCHEYGKVPLWVAALAPYTAKGSTIYNPIIYFLAVKRFRQDVYDVLPCVSTSRANYSQPVTQISSFDKVQNDSYPQDEMSEKVQMRVFISNADAQIPDSDLKLVTGKNGIDESIVQL